MYEFFDVEQNTDEWFARRAGLLTFSNLGYVMANEGKAFGEPAKKLAVDIALEQITGAPGAAGFSNAHMQRGQEQEPMGRYEYEQDTFCTVRNGGFFRDGFCGVSPDGLVGDSGQIEIKSVLPHVHLANIARRNVDPAYKWQCYGALKITRRRWLDFVSFCDEFPPGRRLYIYRVHADRLSDQFSRIDKRVQEFKTLVEQKRDLILNSEYMIFDEKEAA